VRSVENEGMHARGHEETNKTTGNALEWCSAHVG